MKRLSRWQQEKQRTAKALRELPKCDYVECKDRGMGYIGALVGGEFHLLWACPFHAAEAKRIAQRAQRERR